MKECDNVEAGWLKGSLRESGGKRRGYPKIV